MIHPDANLFENVFYDPSQIKRGLQNRVNSYVGGSANGWTEDGDDPLVPEGIFPTDSPHTPVTAAAAVPIRPQKTFIVVKARN